MATAVAMASLLVSIAAPVAAGHAVAAGSHAVATGWVASSHGRAQAAHRIASARAQAAHATAHPRATQARLPRLPGSSAAAHLPASGVPKQALPTRTPRVVLTPSIAVPKQWDGLDQAASGGAYPADPWVAVNATYVVQVVNQAIRITDRNGNLFLTVPTWAFAGALPGQHPTDARIIWDAVHGRWVGEVLTFNSDWSLNYLILMVSDSADPTAGWTTYPVTYSFELPDYPSIASSSDKIVITNNLFDTSAFPSVSLIGADIGVITWASILGGANLNLHECIGVSFVSGRAAQVLSSSPDVHVISEDSATGDQWYDRVTGVGDCAAGQYHDDLNLSSAFGWSPFVDPPDPRQPGPDTLAAAIDGRPTDAVWMNGKLWWVSTYPISYDAGATFNDEVVVWGANTPASGFPTANTTFGFSSADGVDDFMGGIGLARNGTLFVTYSESSTASNIAWFGTAIAGGVAGTPQLLDTSDAATAQDRWGDFAAVATDPVGTGTVWATHMLVAASGDWRTGVARLLLDTDVPGAAGVPTIQAEVSKALTGSPTYRLGWTASSDPSSGSVTYRLEERVDGGAWGVPTLLPGLAINRTLPFGHNYQFRVTPFDLLGNTGPTTQGPVLTPSAPQSPTSKVGTWHSSPSSSYSGASAWYATAAGASATYSSTGLRSIAIVTTKAATRGSFKVYVDGVYKGTVSCYSTTTAFRQIVYQATWAAPGTHIVKIVLSGTAGHPRVEVVAFLILK
jgi:hypothetical protein